MKFPLLSGNRPFLLYGFAMAVFLLLLRWLEWHFLILSFSLELFAGAIAILFTVLGIWLALHLRSPRTVIVEKEVAGPGFVRDVRRLESLGISSRELEVLELMAKGRSNKEIGSELFISMNTVKSHASSLFVKLDVSRRTQAIEKARQWSLIG